MHSSPITFRWFGLLFFDFFLANHDGLCVDREHPGALLGQLHAAAGPCRSRFRAPVFLRRGGRRQHCGRHLLKAGRRARIPALGGGRELITAPALSDRLSRLCESVVKSLAQQETGNSRLYYRHLLSLIYGPHLVILHRSRLQLNAINDDRNQCGVTNSAMSRGYFGAGVATGPQGQPCARQASIGNRVGLTINPSC